MGVVLWFVGMETTYIFYMCRIMNMVVTVTVTIGCHGYIRDWLSWFHL